MINISLKELREAIDNDKALERELFEEFISSSTEIINDLTNHCKGENDNESWKKKAHALKGISLNLGAMSLGELSKIAQEIYNNPMAEKEKILDLIRQDHAEVITFLDQELP